MLFPLILSLIAVACAVVNLALAWSLRARARRLKRLWDEVQAAREEQVAAVARANALAADPPLEFASYDAIAREFWKRHCCGVAFVHRHGEGKAGIHIVNMTPQVACVRLVDCIRSLSLMTLDEIQRAQDQTDAANDGQGPAAGGGSGPQ